MCRPGLVALVLVNFVFHFPLVAVADDAFRHDFRGKPLPAELTLINAEKDNLVQTEPEGLRIRIPKTWIHPPGGVGITTTFGLKGDFDTTVTYEILQADTPPPGTLFGVGLSFVALKPGSGATLAQIVQTSGNEVVLWNLRGKDYRQGAIRAEDKVGRLRLQRKGPTLTYLYAPGAQGADFLPIHQLDFGTDDIERVQTTAVTGRTASNIDLRLLDFRIDAQPGSAPLKTDTKPAGGPALRIGVALVVALAIGLGIGFVLLKRRKRLEPAADSLVIENEEPDEMLLTTCPACAKKLKMKASLAGKKVKCPECGAAVQVQ